MIYVIVFALLTYSLIYRIGYAIFGPTYPTKEEALKAILEKEYRLPISEYRVYHEGYDDAPFWDVIDQRIDRIVNGFEKMPH